MHKGYREQSQSDTRETLCPVWRSPAVFQLSIAGAVSGPLSLDQQIQRIMNSTCIQYNISICVYGNRMSMWSMACAGVRVYGYTLLIIMYKPRVCLQCASSSFILRYFLPPKRAHPLDGSCGPSAWRGGIRRRAYLRACWSGAPWHRYRRRAIR